MNGNINEKEFRIVIILLVMLLIGLIVQTFLSLQSRKTTEDAEEKADSIRQTLPLRKPVLE